MPIDLLSLLRRWLRTIILKFLESKQVYIQYVYHQCSFPFYGSVGYRKDVDRRKNSREDSDFGKRVQKIIVEVYRSLKPAWLYRWREVSMQRRGLFVSEHWSLESWRSLIFLKLFLKKKIIACKKGGRVEAVTEGGGWKVIWVEVKIRENKIRYHSSLVKKDLSYV